MPSNLGELPTVHSGRTHSRGLHNSRVGRHTMLLPRRIVLSSLFLASVLALLPGSIYVIAFSKVHGRPIPADPSTIHSDLVWATWQECGEEPPVTVTRLNPWGVTAQFLLGDPMRAAPG